MPNYPFMQVDAFTTVALGGNPCAIVFEADDLDSNARQAIAREMNLSETAFTQTPPAGSDVAARYFTVDEEIPLAGHPTIATIHALVETGRVKLTGDTTHILLELKVGPIPIEIYASEGKVQRIVMSQKKPQFLTTYDPAQVMPAFGLTPDDLLPGYPVQTVSTGTPQLMMAVRDLEALRRIQVNAPLYNHLRENGDWFSPHLFVAQGVTSEGQTFARHVGPTLEDPFTGSATGGMAAYLYHYGIISQREFIAEQGHWIGRPGQATVEIVGSPDDIETVKVGGSAVTVIKGELLL